MALETARPPASLGIRVILTLAGAAGMILGSFLKWLNDVKGYKGSIRVYYAKTAASNVSFWKSAGGVMIALGLIAVIGLAGRTGWLTRIAGALGVLAFILFAINVYRRSDFSISDFQLGIWLCLAGSLVALVGGFFGSRGVVMAEAPVAPPPPPA
jgi:hypothetical protein